MLNIICNPNWGGKSYTVSSKYMVAVMKLTESNNASMRVFSLPVRQKGGIYIPQDVLNNLQTNVGQFLTLIQIDGFAVLLPNIPKVSELTNNFVSLMNDHQVDLDDLLTDLEQERQAIWQERQVQVSA